jgi:hypothetical protein
MRFIALAILLSGCSVVFAADMPNSTYGPDYVERNAAQLEVAQPATVSETPHAIRGEHLQLAPKPVPPYVPSPNAKCPEWHQVALDAGWGVEHLERLDYIIWRESRCNPAAHNKSDPMTGSRGGAQINGFWCLKNRYEPNPAGYLGAKGIITSCEDLFDPLMNMQSAKAIFDYGVGRNQCPWGPWSTKGSGWCK